MDVVVLFVMGGNMPPAPTSHPRGTAQNARLVSEGIAPAGWVISIARRESLEESVYFGTAFLARIGYFDRRTLLDGRGVSRARRRSNTSRSSSGRI